MKTITCLYCGKETPNNHNTRKKFCDNSCAAKYNNSLRERKPPKKCKCCEKELSRRNKTYCDVKCQHAFKRKELISEWKKGNVTGIIGEDQVSTVIKQYIKEKFDNKCTKCGWAEINPHTNTIPLEVEHIDGNFRNNKEENLELICPNCHSLTATYRGANQGNGRKYRTELYLRNKKRLREIENDQRTTKK